MVRSGACKLICDYETESYELYDVVDDLGETSDLIDRPSHFATAIQLGQEL